MVSATSVPKKQYYLTNKDLLWQLSASHATSGVVDELGVSFIKLATRYQTRSSWYNYPKQIKDELISNAVCELMNAWHKFDFSKSQNPFSYFTSVVANSFRKTINAEKAFLNFKIFYQSIQRDTTGTEYVRAVDRYDGVRKYANELVEDGGKEDEDE